MIVFDASTLILLAKIGILRMVAETFSCTLPKVVLSESVCKQTMDAEVIRQLVDEGIIRILENPPKNKVRHLMERFPVAAGEAASFLIGKEKDAILATDDGIAIKMCKIFGVRFATALHFLIGAKERKHLDEKTALAKLTLLERYGRYAPEIIKDATERIRGR
jgi:predicted nucleic acid-binding protein